MKNNQNSTVSEQPQEFFIEEINKIKEAQIRLSQQLKRAPSPEEIEKLTNLPAAKVRKFLKIASETANLT